MFKSLFSSQSKSAKRPMRGRASSHSFVRDFQQREATRHQDRLQKDETRHQSMRKEERAKCFTMAMMKTPDTGGRLDGVLLNASRNGVTFRPAAHYILAMDGEQIQICCEGVERVGIIRSTRPDGYGIQVFEPFSEDELTRIYDATIELDKVSEPTA